MKCSLISLQSSIFQLYNGYLSTNFTNFATVSPCMSVHMTTQISFPNKTLKKKQQLYQFYEIQNSPFTLPHFSHLWALSPGRILMWFSIGFLPRICRKSHILLWKSFHFFISKQFINFPSLRKKHTLWQTGHSLNTPVVNLPQKNCIIKL